MFHESWSVRVTKHHDACAVFRLGNMTCHHGQLYDHAQNVLAIDWLGLLGRSQHGDWQLYRLVPASFVAVMLVFSRFLFRENSATAASTANSDKQA